MANIYLRTLYVYSNLYFRYVRTYACAIASLYAYSTVCNELSQMEKIQMFHSSYVEQSPCNEPYKPVRNIFDQSHQGTYLLSVRLTLKCLNMMVVYDLLLPM